MEGSNKRKAEADICSFGKLLKEECHKYHIPKSINNFLDLRDEDQIILKWRANLSKSDVNTVCNFHKNKFGEAFVSKYKTANICFDVYEKHKKGKKKTKGGHLVTLEMAKKLKEVGRNCIPGVQVCRCCYTEILQEEDSTEPQYDSPSTSEVSQIQESINRSKVKTKMDESLELVAISPLRTHGLHASKKISVTREKLERSFDKQVTIAAAAINVEKGLLEDDLMDKANNYDRLLYLKIISYQI